MKTNHMKVLKNVAVIALLFVTLSSNAQDETQNVKKGKVSKQKSEAKKQAYKSKQWRQEDVISEETEKTTDPAKPVLRKKAEKLPPPPPPPAPPVPANPSKAKAKNT
ncbi:MAG TPA: hypothetical protein VLJ41_07095 [Segetibacter sp.]|nr:hypothetical protein [Segetibacter sp.]